MKLLKKPERKPLMPGRSQLRMFWAYWWRAVVLMLAWGVVWTAVWHYGGLTVESPLFETSWASASAISLLGRLGDAAAFNQLHRSAMAIVARVAQYLPTGLWSYIWEEHILITTIPLLLCAAALLAAAFCTTKKVLLSPFLVIGLFLLLNSAVRTWELHESERRLGLTPLTYAVQWRMGPERAEELLERGADRQSLQTALDTAASWEDWDTVEVLLEHGADASILNVTELQNLNALGIIANATKVESATP